VGCAVLYTVHLPVSGAVSRMGIRRALRATAHRCPHAASAPAPAPFLKFVLVTMELLRPFKKNILD
jgi:hypothetical protein